MDFNTKPTPLLRPDADLEPFQQAGSLGHESVPLLWCASSPSAPVPGHAFETLYGMPIERLLRCGPVNGVFLDLHGAMVREHYEDDDVEAPGPNVTDPGKLLYRRLRPGVHLGPLGVLFRLSDGMSGSTGGIDQRSVDG